LPLRSPRRQETAGEAMRSARFSTDVSKSSWSEAAVVMMLVDLFDVCNGRRVGPADRRRAAWRRRSVSSPGAASNASEASIPPKTMYCVESFQYARCFSDSARLRSICRFRTAMGLAVGHDALPARRA